MCFFTSSHLSTKGFLKCIELIQNSGESVWKKKDLFNISTVSKIDRFYLLILRKKKTTVSHMIHMEFPMRSWRLKLFSDLPRDPSLLKSNISHLTIWAALQSFHSSVLLLDDSYWLFFIIKYLMKNDNR